MRRPILGGICLGIVMMSCTLADPLGGQCANDLDLGNEACQCVTRDTTYSKNALGYIDPTQTDLSHCIDRYSQLHVNLEPSDIYACHNYRCVAYTCAEDEIPDADRLACIKKAICGTNESYLRESNTCVCDESVYVKVGDACEPSVDGTCDTTKEVYRKSSNTCVCDAESHWTGDAGSCRCMDGYIEIDGQCVESMEKTCEKPKEIFDRSANLCFCNTEGNWTGEAGACVCQPGYFKVNGNTCVIPEDLAVGDEIEFGHYPQDAEREESSPITWQVLNLRCSDVNTFESVLLLSKYALEQYPYHDKYEDITWEKSNVRSYLNGLGAAHNKNKNNHAGKGFIDRAFTAEEQRWIKKASIARAASIINNGISGGGGTEDWIFLLDHREVLQYFPTNRSRIASPTAYAIHPPEGSGRMNLYTCDVTCSGDEDCTDSGCKSDGTKVCGDMQCGSHWWLRSPGMYAHYAAFVWSFGVITSSVATYENVALRPALCLYRASLIKSLSAAGGQASP